MGNTTILKGILQKYLLSNRDYFTHSQNPKLIKNDPTVNNHTGIPPSLSYQQLTSKNNQFLETQNLLRMTPLLIITLVSLLPSAINSLPESVSSSCSSQTCKDCLGSCNGCDSCNLCKLCPEGLSICAKCKYCKNGAEGCKKSCSRGKKEPVCKKCIENCS